MARKKSSLREFQQQLSLRLQQAVTTKAVASKLGFQVAGLNWFVALDDVSEVIPLPVLVGVPLTKKWFLGVANVRGNLYAVTDFSIFLGGEPVSAGYERRMMLLNETIVSGSSIVVSRMLGLKNADSLKPVAMDDPIPLVKARYRDANGDFWHELDVHRLGQEPTFLEVGM